MKVIVRIVQKTLFTNYQGNPDEYSDTLHLEFDNLEDAQGAVNSFPKETIKDLEATILVTLKDYDNRETAEDGEEQ